MLACAEHGWGFVSEHGFGCEWSTEAPHEPASRGTGDARNAGCDDETGPPSSMSSQARTARGSKVNIGYLYFESEGYFGH